MIRSLVFCGMVLAEGELLRTADTVPLVSPTCSAKSWSETTPWTALLRFFLFFMDKVWPLHKSRNGPEEQALCTHWLEGSSDWNTLLAASLRERCQA
jgi:hypothetical protein